MKFNTDLNNLYRTSVFFLIFMKIQSIPMLNCVDFLSVDTLYFLFQYFQSNLINGETEVLTIGKLFTLIC